MKSTEATIDPASLPENNDDTLPRHFVCPITHMCMREPVVAADGHTYERAAIERWLRTSTTSPMTNEVRRARPVAHARTRALARALAHSLTRSLARSLAQAVSSTRLVDNFTIKSLIAEHITRMRPVYDAREAPVR